MQERTFDVMVRVHYLPDVEVDGVTTAEPGDWNWDEIVTSSVKSCTFVSVLYADEQIKETRVL